MRADLAVGLDDAAGDDDGDGAEGDRREPAGPLEGAARVRLAQHADEQHGQAAQPDGHAPEVDDGGEEARRPAQRPVVP